MDRPRRRTLGLTGGFVVSTGTAAVVALVLGGSAVLQSQQQAARTYDLEHDGVAVLQAALQVKGEHAVANLNWLNVMAATPQTTPAQIAEWTTLKDQGQRQVTDGLDLLSARATSARQVELLRQIKADLSTSDAAMAVPLTAPAAELVKATDDYNRAEASFAEHVTALVDLSQRQVHAMVTESRQASTRAAVLAAVSLLVGLGLALLASVAVLRRLRRDARAIAASARSLQAGDLTARTGVVRHDELGTIASSLDVALDSLARQFSAVTAAASALEGSSRDLVSTGTAAGAAVDHAGREVDEVAHEVGRVTSSLQTVSAASDEMESAIRDIAASAAQATEVASQAVRTAQDANVLVSRLGQSSAEIGDVVKVITAIAEQTNLLALNATIEAARAGETGKGFAVVAGEVKELAQQTARATEDIARRVTAIQSDTDGAVQAIGSIGEVIARVSDLQTTIASAVEEQSATTSEITRALGEASGGAARIDSSIGGVARSAHTTQASVDATRQAADAVEDVAGDLRTVVGRFRL